MQEKLIKLIAHLLMLDCTLTDTGGLLFFMTKKEIASLFEWLVDMKEIIKTKEEINHLTDYYYSTFKHINLDFLPDKRWKDLVQYWLEYKKEKRQNYKTEKSIKIFCKHLIELSQGNYDIAAAIIQNSIANNYSGIFQLKNNAKINSNNEANELNQTIEKHFAHL